MFLKGRAPLILKNNYVFLKRYHYNEQFSKYRSYRNKYTYSLLVGSSLFLIYNLNDYLMKDVYIFKGIFRFFRVIKTGILISSDYWSLENSFFGSKILSDDELDKEYKRCHRMSAERILNLALNNKGLFIKLGQNIASLNHVLPSEYIETLMPLFDKTLNQSYDKVELMMKEDFNKNINELFKYFNPIPLASASLAQVHDAITHDGEKVAVKIQFYELGNLLKFDLIAISLLMKIVLYVHPKFSLFWVFESIKTQIVKELDFQNEIANCKRCYNDLKHFDYFYVPKVYDQLSSKRVITMEYIDGIKVTDLEKLNEMNIDKKLLSQRLTEIFAYQIFGSGFIHADPHQSNIFVRKLPDGSPEIILLDHGLYQEISPSLKINLCKFWIHGILADDKSLKSISKEFNVDDFVVLYEIIFQRPYSSSTIKDIIKFSKLTPEELRNMMSKSSDRIERIILVLKQMPPDMIFVTRNLNIVRSLIFQLGNVVDRCRIIALCALSNISLHENKDQPTQAIRSRSSNNDWLSLINQYIFKLKFYYRLKLNGLMFWFYNLFIQI